MSVRVVQEQHTGKESEAQYTRPPCTTGAYKGERDSRFSFPRPQPLLHPKQKERSGGRTSSPHIYIYICCRVPPQALSSTYIRYEDTRCIISCVFPHLLDFFLSLVGGGFFAAFPFTDRCSLRVVRAFCHPAPLRQSIDKLSGVTCSGPLLSVFSSPLSLSLFPLPTPARLSLFCFLFPLFFVFSFVFVSAVSEGYLGVTIDHNRINAK